MGCDFRVGQRVVCVNADRAKNLSFGTVYTIKSIRFENKCLGLTGVLTDYAVLLVEAEPNSPTHIGFCPTRFRPIVERKTDISIFKALLKQSKEQVSA